MELNRYFSLMVAALLFISPSATALFIDDLNIDLSAKKRVHYEEVVNRTHGKKIYTVSMVQVTTPRINGRETVINDGALLYSPQKIVLNSGEKGGFKFYYKGELDAKERYFRVKFVETPVVLDTMTANKKTLFYDYRVAVEAILVVRPAIEKFSYEFKMGEVKNDGNTYFKYMSSQGCGKKYTHSAFLAPGEKLVINDEHAQENRVIVYQKKIITLSQCRNAQM